MVALNIAAPRILSRTEEQPDSNSTDRRTVTYVDVVDKLFSDWGIA